MENSAVESTDRFRPAHDPLPGRVAGVGDRKMPMDLSSVIAKAAAVLPFAAVLALCLFLLSLPSGEGRRLVPRRRRTCCGHQTRCGFRDGDMVGPQGKA